VKPSRDLARISGLTAIESRFPFNGPFDRPVNSESDFAASDSDRRTAVIALSLAPDSDIPVAGSLEGAPFDEAVSSAPFSSLSESPVETPSFGAIGCEAAYRVVTASATTLPVITGSYAALGQGQEHADGAVGLSETLKQTFSLTTANAVGSAEYGLNYPHSGGLIAGVTEGETPETPQGGITGNSTVKLAESLRLNPLGQAPNALGMSQVADTFKADSVSSGASMPNASEAFVGVLAGRPTFDQMAEEASSSRAADDRDASLDEAGISNQLANYDLNRALQAAWLSDAAYLSGTQLQTRLTELGWTPLQANDETPLPRPLDAGGGFTSDNGFVEPLSSNSAYAFAASREAGEVKEYVISFAGTDFSTMGDIQTDFFTWGFAAYYKQMQSLFAEVLLQALADQDAGMDVKLLITGHSLGGAVAQAAFADLMIGSAQSLWTDPEAPLGAGERLYDIDPIWSRATDIARLVDDTQVISFGAPSLLVDYEKLDAIDLALVVAAFLAGGPVVGTEAALLLMLAHEGAWANPAEALNLGSAGKQEFADRYHQFELNDSSLDRIGLFDDDPVAAIGPIDLGATFNIDISEGAIDGTSATLHDRYEGLTSFFAPATHSLGNYTESILRGLTSSPLMLPASEAASQSPVLPRVSNGTAGNDLIAVGLSAASGLGGNDILYTTANMGAVSMDGGAGVDAFVIKAHGVNATISRLEGERNDHLYFQVVGTLSADFVDDDLSFVLTSMDQPDTTVLVQGWYDRNANYELASVVQIATNEDVNWAGSLISLRALGAPLFLSGTSANDYVIGSRSDDPDLIGGLGNDSINGREGNDIVYGDLGGAGATVPGGNDTVNGGAGNDTLYSGPGGTTFFVGTAATTYWSVEVATTQ
jgi:Lipase (class 3)/RTX calcium-binding nonapeptide repeat (4 copies)